MDGVLARDLWPVELQINVSSDVEKSKHLLWQVVPPSFEDVCEWACVTKHVGSIDPSRQHIVIYKQPDSVGFPSLFLVTVRLQGFLHSFRLGDVGNWDG